MGETKSYSYFARRDPSQLIPCKIIVQPRTKLHWPDFHLLPYFDAIWYFDSTGKLKVWSKFRGEDVVPFPHLSKTYEQKLQKFRLFERKAFASCLYFLKLGPPRVVSAQPLRRSSSAPTMVRDLSYWDSQHTSEQVGSLLKEETKGDSDDDQSRRGFIFHLHFGLQQFSFFLAL